jgi:THAP4-like, heme-binding beta-barrel domain
VTEAALHPDVRALAGLLGTWRGEGAGEYPTIAPFRYREEVRFWHVGKPFLAYAQRTWALDDGRPLHAETGYWRATPAGTVEVVLAHPTGIAEVLAGRLAGPEAAGGRRRIELASTAIARTGSAKQVGELRRVFELDGAVLAYTLAMAAVGQPLRHHLAAELHRTGSPDPGG